MGQSGCGFTGALVNWQQYGFSITSLPHHPNPLFQEIRRDSVVQIERSVVLPEIVTFPKRCTGFDLQINHYLQKLVHLG